MSRNQTLLGALCLLLLGLLVGYFAGSGGPNLDDIDAAVAARVDAADKASAERVAGLETRIDDLSTRLDDIKAQVASGSDAVAGVGDKLDTDVEKISSDIGGVAKSVGDQIETATAAHLAALESGLSGLRADLSTGSAATPADEAPAPAAAASTAEPTAAAERGTAPAGQSAGETAELSDGAIRVFVSRVDDSAGTARLNINGTNATLGSGQSQTFTANGSDCRVTLAAIDRGHVVLAGGCGGDLPEPEGTAPGNTVTLGDGAARVFVSGITGKGARIAINGVESHTVAAGELVDVGDKGCKVTVKSIDRGHVALDYACGS